MVLEEWFIKCSTAALGCVPIKKNQTYPLTLKELERLMSRQIKLPEWFVESARQSCLLATI